MARKRVAVVGAGVSGLGAAFLLARGGHAVTVYEARRAAGGHARTVDVALPPGSPRPSVAVDTGFIVYNAATYPDLVSLFETLRVPQDNSSMSFAASVDTPDGGRLEWGSDSLDALFADRRNLARPAFYSMLYDTRRFNAAVHAYVARVDAAPDAPEAAQTLADFLHAGAYSPAFVSAYLIPMVSSVWSASFRAALAFPARTLLRFFVNHGLAQTFARPQWRTPLRRSRDYVAAVLEDLAAHGAAVHLATPVTRVTRSAAAATVSTPAGDAAFDQVVFACHAPAALALLGAGATAAERRILGAFRYAQNTVVVHTDDRLMPAARGAWSAWNFVSRRGPEAEAAAAARGGGDGGRALAAENRPVCVTYWLNRLQNLNRGAAGMPELFETLNPCVRVDPAKVLREDTFDHPQLTEEGVRAQAELQNVIQGENRSWFCGAYARYGFHEDGLMTGLDVAERLTGYRVLRPWRSKPRLAINNSYRRYVAPFASPPSLGIIYLGGLFVVNLVGARIRAGLTVLSKRLTPDEPSVVLSTGNGTLLRFGHATAASSQPGLVNVRSPQLLARVTDAIRHHRDLVPVAVESFVAGEIDCPLPADLTTMLHALILAQRKGPEVGHGLQGQMHLAETLLHAVVGGFEPVSPPVSVSRLPELTTAVYSVVFPCWWLADAAGRGGATGGGIGSDGARPGGGGAARPDQPAGAAPDAGAHSILELVGELSAATVGALQANPSARATVVAPAPDRVPYVETKAKLLKVHDQVRVVSVDVFLAAREGARERYNRVISPAAVNVCDGRGVFPSLADLMRCVWRLLAEDGGVAELGFAACDEGHAQKRARQRQAADALFCGDPGYRLWSTRAVLDAASGAGFRLASMLHMPAAEAARGVEATIDRVVTSLASEKMTTAEIRRALGQFCLWQAALRSGVTSRAVVILRRPPAVSGA